MGKGRVLTEKQVVEGRGHFWLSGAVFSERVYMTIVMYMEVGLVSSETSELKAQTPGDYPKNTI